MKTLTQVASVLASAFLAMSVSTIYASDVEGTSNAVFVNPSPAGKVVTGVGTSAFTWGTAMPNSSSMAFEGAHFSSALETPFKLGRLSYFNGTVVHDSAPDAVDLLVNISFTQPAIPNVSANFGLALINTPNNSTEAANADYVKFNSTFSSNSFLIDGTAYKVKITGFDNVVGDGFLVSNSSQFHVLEGFTASADLYGTVAAVPEPESYAMMMAGLGLVGSLVRRRKQNR